MKSESGSRGLLIHFYIPRVAPSLKILYVGKCEHEESLRKLLLQYGIDTEFSCIQTGEEAVNRYELRLPDVILVDVILEGMTGLETARWIKEQTKQVKVVLVSEGINHRLLVENELHIFCDAHIKKNSTVDMYASLLLRLKGMPS